MEVIIDDDISQMNPEPEKPLSKRSIIAKENIPNIITPVLML
ncbi:MAG TPA: hypothetical protein PLQ09_10040 [Prolixibacteraceae bacterium]|nr:hypothetical protein [Prolixibacteraceae bacterium]